MAVEVAMAPGLLRQSAAFEPQHLVRTRPRRNRDGDLACGRLDRNLGAEHGVGERNLDVGLQVAPLDAVARMPAEADLDQRVARPAESRLALPLEADGLAVF